eukprot:c7334_g1_i1.p1 GENE.c7334_g1_i1~~c7334_g1_i1.p1  ORF type:complete len:300 (-),score=117.30 c7334_g1_i1:65-964(-)
MFDEVFSNPRNSAEGEGDQKALKNNTDSYQAQQVASDVVEGVLAIEKKLGVGESVQTNLLFLAIASVVEFGSAASGCEKRCMAAQLYAAFVGFISLACTVGLLVVQAKTPLMARLVEPPVCIFLVVWWGFGAPITTFVGPFIEVKNGFFATWAALFLSLNLATLTLRQLSSPLARLQSREGTSQKVIFIVLFASVILLIAAALLCANGKKCEIVNYEYIIPGSVFSFVVSSIMLCRARGFVGFSSVKTLSYVLAALWIAITVLVTFDEEMDEIGNIYFASWCCCISSIYLAYFEYMHSD